MINNEIRAYVRRQQDAGFDDETIREALESNGWVAEDIDALLLPKTEVPATPPVVAELPAFPQEQPNTIQTEQTTATHDVLTTSTTKVENLEQKQIQVTEIIFPASAAQRLINHFVDILIQCALFAILLYSFLFYSTRFVYNDPSGSILFPLLLLLENPDNMLFTTIFAIVIIFIIFIIYYELFEAIFKRTIGKMLTGTKVVRYDGERAGILRILSRTLLRLIPFEAFSFFFYGNFPTRGWHDRFSGTLVVSNKLQTAAEIQNINYKYIQDSPKNKFSILFKIIISTIVLFTVFAIISISILSLITLASYSSAKNKAGDATIQNYLNDIQVNALSYYDTHNNTYSGVCQNDPTIVYSLNKIRQNNDATVTCNVTPDAFAIVAKLSTGKTYCVDSNGFKYSIPTDLPTNKTSCQ